MLDNVLKFYKKILLLYDYSEHYNIKNELFHYIRILRVFYQ